MIHSGNEPLLISGVGTGTLEILEQEPGIEVIVVPIGGGSGGAGACIVAKAVNSTIRVIGVQSEAAPAAYRTWKEGVRSRRKWGRSPRALRLGPVRAAPADPPAAPRRLRARERRRDPGGTALMIEGTRNLIEAAGASPLAAALRLREELAGKRVALVASGGNVSPAQLRELLER